VQPAAFTFYLRAIEKALRSGTATEHTYRPALKQLLEAGRPGVSAVNEPRRTACGAPDFIVESHATPLGYVETKAPGADLDAEQDSEQLRRYRGALPNLILTDYIEFRWYIRGELRSIASMGALQRHALRPADDLSPVQTLLASFFQPPTAMIRTPRELAERMAAVARLIRGSLTAALADPAADDRLVQQLAGFRKILIEDLSEAQFADMYAQTLCYGMFAARCNNGSRTERFSRENAAFDLPRTNPFLRRLFNHLAGPDLDDRVAWAVDDLAELLSVCDINAILGDFGRRQRRHDPVIHFYETFLSVYDPETRALRGVYYTPEPAVQYIVRSVDHILRSRFKIEDGLADDGLVTHQTRKAKRLGTTDKARKRERAEEKESEIEVHKVLILDPAAGTGTFLAEVIRSIHQHVTEAGNAGVWSDYVSRHLLPRLYGFELLMAPYAIAHMKLGLQLTETGYDFRSPERLRVFLTNTLEEPHALTELPLFTEWLAEEANAASHVKRDLPIMVVLGNPPYSNFGRMNRGKWILELLREYKEGLNERKLNLDDDFIKFIRFSQWRIDRTGAGVLAFITSNTYLDGITHRRMRESLLRSFSEIFILDLHGSSKKQEKTPEGLKDENVFDIQQGVSIAFMIKHRTRSATGLAVVHHADLWGTRDSKYQSLERLNILDQNWRDLEPAAPHYFLRPRDLQRSEEYARYLSLHGDIFRQKNTGIQTKRDSLVYHFDKAELAAVLDDARALTPSRLSTKYDLPPDGRDWTAASAMADVRGKSGTVQPVLYHPFDVRWTLYTGKTKGWMAYPRSPLMQSALRPNLLLLTVRNARRNNVDSFFVATTLVDKDAVSPFDNATFFPLYVYPVGDPGNRLRFDERQLNLAEGLLADLMSHLRLETITPEQVFYYIYALLHAPSYRERYGELLTIEYSRIPFTSDAQMFIKLTALGEDLVRIHTLSETLPVVSRFPVKGGCEVERPRLADGRMYINDLQYFEGVDDSVWEHTIGGSRIVEKWLKERRGRTLSFADIKQVHQIVAAIARTIVLTKALDEIIASAGGWPLIGAADFGRTGDTA